VTAPAQAPALSISPIGDTDVAAVIALWQACDLTRPWNNPAADIALARRGPNSAILIGRDGDAMIASALVGHDGHRGWVYYVTVDPDHRHKRTRLDWGDGPEWTRGAITYAGSPGAQRPGAQRNA